MPSWAECSTISGVPSRPRSSVGDRLGLFKALAADGPAGSWELSRRTGTSERMVREWLASMGASGYLEYDSASQRYSIEPEKAMVFADEDSPVFLAGMFESLAAMFYAVPKIEKAFRSGKGLGWHEHDQCLFTGTERFFRTSYSHHLVQDWLPALEGMTAKLQKGARVADAGCGHGASTIIMARRSRSQVHRLSTTTPVDRACPASRREGRGRRSRDLRGGAGEVSGYWLRPRHFLRLSA